MIASKLLLASTTTTSLSLLRNTSTIFTDFHATNSSILRANSVNNSLDNIRHHSSLQQQQQQQQTATKATQEVVKTRTKRSTKESSQQNDTLSSVITMKLQVEEPKAEDLNKFGLYISGKEVLNPGLTIPFYKTVLEGQNLDFRCHGFPTMRTATILGAPLKQPRNVKWLERHMRMTQLFIGLGSEPFVMVLAPPSASDRPDLSAVRAYKFAAGSGIILHEGTWHDFPIAMKKNVTVFTMNSPEVVEALSSMKAPGEMDHGDVFKLDLIKRFNTTFNVHLQ